MGIVVIGAIFIDIKGYPETQYIPRGRNVGRVEQVHGGVCRNVAENIANVELRPTLISLVDHSALSDAAIKKLNDHKVNTSYIRRTDNGLGTWLAVFNSDGDVEASISKRPDLYPITEILDEQGDEIIQSCDSICVEIDIEKENAKRIFSLAKKYNKDVFAVVSNMSIAVKRRDLMKQVACLVCNQQEAGILFMENYDDFTPEQMVAVLENRIRNANIRRMVVTMGSAGAVYADCNGDTGFVPAPKVDVVDTTGAGDAFFSGVAIGLTYGKTLAQACEIGTRLAASVICTMDSVCPRFLPSEFGLDVEVTE